MRGRIKKGVGSKEDPIICINGEWRRVHPIVHENRPPSTSLYKDGTMVGRYEDYPFVIIKCPFCVRQMMFRHAEGIRTAPDFKRVRTNIVANKIRAHVGEEHPERIKRYLGTYGKRW